MTISDLREMLRCCRGEGIVVTCRPSVPEQRRFYAGSTRLAVDSFHEALLLVLGGRDGAEQRYERILVVSAGHRYRDSDACGSLGIPADRVDRYGCWWFRGAPEGAERPMSAAARAAAIEGTGAPPDEEGDEPFPAYRDPIPQGEREDYLGRVRWLCDIIEDLGGSRRTLLLVEADVFDYPISSRDKCMAGGLTEDGLRLLDTLEKKGLDIRGKMVDVVFFSRRPDTIDRLVRVGLPRLPATEGRPLVDGTWPRLTVKVDAEFTFPNGPMPWDEFLTRSKDGTLASRVVNGGLSLRVVPAKVPPRTMPDDLDLAFWKAVDPEVIEHRLEDRCFGASRLPAVRTLLDGIRELHAVGSQGELTDSQRESWKQKSALLLYGQAGAGKNHLSKALSWAIYDREAITVQLGGQDGQSLAWLLFGPADGYVNADIPSCLYSGVRAARGYVAVCFSEIEKVRQQGGGAFDPFADFLSERRMQPGSGGLRPASLWNTIITFTSNLEDEAELPEFFGDRVGKCRYEPLSDADLAAFVIWRLQRAVQTSIPDRICRNALEVSDVSGVLPKGVRTLRGIDGRLAELFRAAGKLRPPKGDRAVLDVTQELRSCLRDFRAARR